MDWSYQREEFVGCLVGCLYKNLENAIPIKNALQRFLANFIRRKNIFGKKSFSTPPPVWYLINILFVREVRKVRKEYEELEARLIAMEDSDPSRVPEKPFP